MKNILIYLTVLPSFFFY